MKRNKIFLKLISKSKKELFLTVLVKIIFAGLLSLVSYYFTVLFGAFTNKSQFNESIFIMSIIFIFTILFAFLSEFLKSYYIKKVNIEFKAIITKKVLSDPMELITNKNTGKLMSWYVNDAKQIESLSFDNLINFCFYMALVMSAFFGLFLIHWLIAIGSLVLFVFSIVFPQLAQKAIYKAQTLFTQADERFTEEVRDNIDSLSTLMFADKLNQYEQKSQLSVFNRETSLCKFNITNAKVSALMMFVSLFSQFGLIIFAFYLSLLGYMDISSVVGITALSGNFFNGIQGLINSIVTFNSAKPLYDKFDYDNQLLDNKINVSNLEKIKLDNVSFAYDDLNIIDNLSLVFEKGKKYALIGESGSGKTTLLKLILKLVLPNKGVITLNDHNINDVDIMSYYQHIAYIEQNVYLFNGTIKDNILLGTNISDQELDIIIKQAKLDSFVTKSNEGLNTIISSNGNGVSGGEKQRIAIARALVKKVSYIIIDEATSQLDKSNAIDIEKSLLDIDGVGILMISHHFDQEILSKFDSVIDLNII